MVELGFFFSLPLAEPEGMCNSPDRDPPAASEAQVQSLNLCTTREAHVDYFMQNCLTYCHTKTIREMLFSHCADKNIQHEKINLLKELHRFCCHKYLDFMPGLLSISL